MKYVLYSAAPGGKVVQHGEIDGYDELDVHHKTELIVDRLKVEQPETANHVFHSEPSFAY